MTHATKESKADLIAQYPYLESSGHSVKSPWALAAANIRRELRRAFPGVKFSIKSKTYAGGDSVHIHWQDGPPSDKVGEIANKYQYGYFDGMEDLYHYSGDSSWTDTFGSAKYVLCYRSLSEAVQRKAAVEWNYDYDNLTIDERRHLNSIIRDKAY
jgi:hypothetical protein